MAWNVGGLRTARFLRADSPLAHERLQRGYDGPRVVATRGQRQHLRARLRPFALAAKNRRAGRRLATVRQRELVVRLHLTHEVVDGGSRVANRGGDVRALRAELVD